MNKKLAPHRDHYVSVRLADDECAGFVTESEKNSTSTSTRTICPEGNGSYG